MFDDSGWYRILIEDDETPAVRLEAGGFPDQKTAMWFVSAVEEFMDQLQVGEYLDDEYEPPSGLTIN